MFKLFHLVVGEDLYRHSLLSNPIDLSIKYLKWNEKVSLERGDTVKVTIPKSCIKNTIISSSSSWDIFNDNVNGRTRWLQYSPLSTSGGIITVMIYDLGAYKQSSWFAIWVGRKAVLIFSLHKNSKIRHFCSKNVYEGPILIYPSGNRILVYGLSDLSKH